MRRRHHSIPDLSRLPGAGLLTGHGLAEFPGIDPARIVCSVPEGPSRFSQRQAFQQSRQPDLSYVPVAPMRLILRNASDLPIPLNLGEIEGERKRHSRGYDDQSQSVTEMVLGLFVTLCILVVAGLFLGAM